MMAGDTTRRAAGDSLTKPGQERARVPFGNARSKLSAPGRSGFVRRWFNDVSSRIKEALSAGWEFVDDPEHIGDGPETRDSGLGAAVSQVVGVDRQGIPMSAYLMEIRQDWYYEDQDKKIQETKATDIAIARGMVGPSAGDGGYVPPNGINIR